MEALIYVKTELSPDDMQRFFEELKRIAPGCSFVTEDTMPEPVNDVQLHVDTSKVNECAYCGADFVPKTKRSKYCSKNCASMHRYYTLRQADDKRVDRRKYESRVCVHCGKEYIPVRSNQKTCGGQCARDYWKLTKDEKKPKFRRREMFDKVCKACGKTYSTGMPQSRYCSPSCSQRAWRNRKNGLPDDYIKAKVLYRPKTDKKTNITIKSSAARADKELLQEKVIPPPPDLTQKIPLRIDHRTVIYIKPDEDPEEAKARFLLKHKM